jgi:hypothetical protein
MQVRILKETPYEPQQGDSPRCVGQLQVRHPRRVIEFSAEHGVKDKTEAGPRQYVFPVGSTPVVSDEFGAGLIADGSAELFNGPEVLSKTVAEILDGMVQLQ